MERMRNLNSGLGQFCLHLGSALAAQPVTECHFEAYLPGKLSGIFGADVSCRPARKWHKISGVSTNSQLWHCMHQDSAYFPQNRNTRVSMTIHDLNYLERTDYSGEKKTRKTRQLQKRVNRCAGLVYVSNFVKEQAHDQLNIPKHLPEAVVYNGVAVPEQVETHKTRAPYLFSIGLHPKKNYAVALPILQRNPRLTWVIAGGDNKGYRQELTNAAEALQVANRLHFTGTVTETEKWNLYAHCEALIFPSLAEGFGLPVIEAMAFGKPVFLSNRSSLPEIGGAEAYYFDSFEAARVSGIFEYGMKDFTKNPEKAQRLKARARSFTWENAASEYLKFFHQILQ